MQLHRVGAALGAVILSGISTQATTQPAQSAAPGQALPPAANQLSLTGCLARGPGGQFHLIDTAPLTSGLPAPPHGLAWSLSEHAGLSPLVGTRVEVAGTSDWDHDVATATAPAWGPVSVPPSPQTHAERITGNDVTTLSESAFRLDVQSIQAADGACGTQSE